MMQYDAVWCRGINYAREELWQPLAMYFDVFCLRSSGGFSDCFSDDQWWPNPLTCQQNPTKVPARREAHHLDLQGWPCLNFFNVCGIWLNEWLIWLILLNMLNNLEGIGGTELLKLQADSGFPPPLTSLGRGNMRLSSGHRCEGCEGCWRLPLPALSPASCASCKCEMVRAGCGLSHYHHTISARERSYYGNDNVITNLPSLCLSQQLPWSIMINLWSISEKKNTSHFQDITTGNLTWLLKITMLNG